jgi:class 3 adenylate cyclase
VSEPQAVILIVDDHATNRMRLSMAVKHLGYAAETAEHGREALDRLRNESFDLVLLDILMPEMDGYEVLEEMKRTPELRGIPVIVISAVDEMESVVACIELGAEDHLPKAFDPVLLRARINACLEKKRLRDAVDRQMKFIREAFGKYVPDTVAAAVVESQGRLEPIRTEATILHTDIEGFTGIVEANPPQKSFQMINEYYAVAIEQIQQSGGVVNQFQGDSMQVLFNVPVADPKHADRAVRTALRIQEAVRDRVFAGTRLRTRIGICTGEVIAGNVGSSDRLNYTVVGDPVNIAARLEQLNKKYGTLVLVSGTTVDKLTEDFPLEPTGDVEVRGKLEPIRVSKLAV